MVSCGVQVGGGGEEREGERGGADTCAEARVRMHRYRHPLHVYSVRETYWYLIQVTFQISFSDTSSCATSRYRSDSPPSDAEFTCIGKAEGLESCILPLLLRCLQNSRPQANLREREREREREFGVQAGAEEDRKRWCRGVV